MRYCYKSSIVSSNGTSATTFYVRFDFVDLCDLFDMFFTLGFLLCFAWRTVFSSIFLFLFSSLNWTIHSFLAGFTWPDLRRWWLYFKKNIEKILPSPLFFVFLLLSPFYGRPVKGLVLVALFVTPEWGWSSSWGGEGNNTNNRWHKKRKKYSPNGGRHRATGHLLQLAGDGSLVQFGGAQTAKRSGVGLLLWTKDKKDRWSQQGPVCEINI